MCEGFTITTSDEGENYRISTGKVDIDVKNDNLPFGYFNIKVYFGRLGHPGYKAGAESK